MGHGDHWAALDPDVQGLIARILPVAVEQGEVADVTRVRGVFPGGTEEQDTAVYSIDYPTAGPFRFRILHWADPPTKTVRVFSAFPMASCGFATDVRIDEIREWEYGLEAVIVGATYQDAMVAFFDTAYFKNKDRYRVGEWYTFSLAGLAYSLESAKGDHVVRDDQEFLRRWYEVIGEEPPRDERGLIPS
jgi:hypothetical protein